MTSFWLFSLKQTKKNKRCFDIKNMVKCGSNLSEYVLVLRNSDARVFLVDLSMLLVLAQGGTAGLLLCGPWPWRVMDCFNAPPHSLHFSMSLQ